MGQYSDEYFDANIKNNFLIGYYQGCIEQGQQLRLSPEKHLERDIFVFRAYIAQKKYTVVLDEISKSSPPALQAVRQYAQYLHSSSKSIVLDELKSKMQSFDAANDVVMLMAASIFYHEQEYEDALRCLHQSSNLECMGLSVKIYMALDRLDLAAKEIKNMIDIDEDATVTQLTMASFCIAKGGSKLKEAFDIFQEMVDKYCSTPLLLNGMAVSCIHQGKMDMAVEYLKEALDKDPNHPETLINLIVASHHIGKTEVVGRYYSQLKDSHPNHPYIKDCTQKEADFDRACAALSVNA